MKTKFLAGACLASLMSAPALAQESLPETAAATEAAASDPAEIDEPAMASEVSRQDVGDGSAPAHKVTVYLEAGPSVLLTELEGEIDDLLLEDNISLNAITVRGGLELSEFLSFEADLAVGVSGENINESVSIYEIDGTFKGDVRLNYLAGLYVKGQFPLTDSGRIKAMARIGYVVSEIEANGVITAELSEPPAVEIFDTAFSLPSSYSATGAFAAERSGLVGGGGVELGLSERLYLRGEVTYYALENAPTVSATALLGYRF